MTAAFPTQTFQEIGDGVVAHFQLEGMDLRDYFAAKAMQGLVTEGKCSGRHEIAELSYSISDAMMEARKK